MFHRKLLFSMFNIAARTYSSRIVTMRSRSVFKKCIAISGNSVLNVPVVKMSSGDTHLSATFEDVKQINDNKTVLLIDVREPNELQETGVIPGSINIPLAEVESTLQTLPPNEFLQKYNRNKPQEYTPIVFSCRSGNRSGKAQDIAFKLGYKDVRNYKGGWLDWEQKIQEK